MSRYRGLDKDLKRYVAERDRYRCRWCGRTNVGLDAHHIRYRRGAVDDVADNLICLCRECHQFVHGQKLGLATISKDEAQTLLYELVERPGLTGLQLVRQQANSVR